MIEPLEGVLGGLIRVLGVKASLEASLCIGARRPALPGRFAYKEEVAAMFLNFEGAIDGNAHAAGQHQECALPCGIERSLSNKSIHGVPSIRSRR